LHRSKGLENAAEITKDFIAAAQHEKS